MIYTVTLNPSIDHILEADSIEEGQTNRARKEYFRPGGKGINVSSVLKNLGTESVALGFVGGFSGEYIRESLDKMQLSSDFTALTGRITRINTKIKLCGEQRVREAEINSPGAQVFREDFEQLLKRLDALHAGDWLVLSGSLPPGLGETAYAEICRRMSARGVRLVVDTAGKALLKTLESHPFLVKPNRAELGDLFGAIIDSDEKAAEYGRRLIKAGAQNVIVSLGSAGACMIGQGGAYDKIEALSGQVVDTVGAGDSLIAGFLAYLLQRGENALTDVTLLRQAFRYGVCAASATAFSQGFAKKEDTDRLFRVCMQTL